MTRIYIELPEGLAEEARTAGILEPPQIREILEDELRRRRAAGRLAEIMRRPTDEPPMSPEEVQGEIDAYRREKRQQRDAARP